MAEYIIESRSKTGTYLAHLPFRDLQGEFGYNKADEVRFTMALPHLNELTENDIYPAKTEIWVIRNGVKVFCGPLWDLHISSSNNQVSLMAQDISSYFEKRQLTTARQLTGTYGSMAWTLISETQSRTNGNLSITRGTQVPANGPSASKYKIKSATMLDVALEELYDGSNGFDWTITPDRVYHQYYPRLRTRAKVRLEYRGNIKSYADAIQGKYIGNSVRTIGKDGLLSDFAINSNSQTIFGLMDFVGEQTGLSNKGLLNEHNARTLERRSAPYRDPTIVLNSEMLNPFEGDIGFGQIATVVIEDGFVQYNKDMLCKGFQLHYSKSGSETFTLYMNEVPA